VWRVAGAVAAVTLLRVDGLTKRYGSVTALDGLTAEVPRGLVGVVGANGAGKTTLFRILLGLARPTAGAVEVVGIRVADDPVGVRSRLGYMPEHECLPLDQSAADVVATFGEISGLPAKAARQRASDVLDLVGLDEARFRPIGGFSTGMRQRAKLAQALVGDPELVLLDEPTAGLDPAGREEMLELVGRLGVFGISVLMSTHLLDDVQRVCDQVLMIDAGHLVVAGPTASLLEPTGAVGVDVGDPAGAVALRDHLAARGLAVTVVDGEVQLEGADDEVVEQVVAAVAELGLPLFRLGARATSLDDVFLERAAR
jgi:ABC-2 type transport system ATP-binding protein